MAFSWSNQERPIVALSPMADMTDSSFCQVTREEVNKDVNQSRLIMFREMVSSEAVVRGNEKTLGMTEIHPAERPLVQQIFGSDPDIMAESAAIVEQQFHPEAIDINMGCPVYKITSNFNGSALMKDVPLAKEIVQKMKAAISIPLSVKMRAGWSDHKECIEFAKHMEDAGADLLTIHGRTKVQGYAGLANREVVAAAKQQVSIPVLYNGDVFTWQDYQQALEDTQCDGVLVARGALGNPWIFAQIEQHLAGKTPIDISMERRIDTVKRHLAYHVEQYGEQSVPTFRKHLSWYFKGVENFKQYKIQLMQSTDAHEIGAILDEFAASRP